MGNGIGFSLEKLAHRHPKVQRNFILEIQAGMIENIDKIIGTIKKVGTVGISKTIIDRRGTRNNSMISKPAFIICIAAKCVKCNQSPHNYTDAICCLASPTVINHAVDVIVSNCIRCRPGNSSTTSGK